MLLTIAAATSKTQMQLIRAGLREHVSARNPYFYEILRLPKRRCVC